MSNRFVRASKYRHVFGRNTKKEQCYDNLRITSNAWDTNLIKVNPKYISVNWEAAGGGAFAVIPLEERGKAPEHIPLFRGHTAAVLDTDWNPFDDNLIASCSDDAKVNIYRVPDNFSILSDSSINRDVEPVKKFSGHSRKVGHVLFNPAVSNILASSSGDYTVKIWDLNSGAAKLTLKHGDIVQSLSWSGEGSMLVTTCRDKKLRFWDVRQERAAQEVSGHAGAKNSRVVWLGEHDRVATTGFSRMSDRQMALWDPRNPVEPIGGFTVLDSLSGVCMPFWDDGTQMLYLAGKGDGNIRYYEYANDKFEFLSEYKSVEPQRGLAFLPKRGVDLHENEVMRAFKTVNDNYIEPISFIVPRRAEVFQSDIYPPAMGNKPAMTSDDYLGGKTTSFPPKISLESIYEGGGIKEVISDAKPRSTTAPITSSTSPTKTTSAVSSISPVKARDEQTSTPLRSQPPISLKDNKASISSIASKYQDKQEAEISDDSSFEEVSKPIERPSIHNRQQSSSRARTPSPIKTDVSKPTSGPSLLDTPSRQVSKSSEISEVTSPSGASRAAEGLKGALQEIRNMLSQQASQIKEQGETLENLTREVLALKTRLGEQA